MSKRTYEAIGRFCGKLREELAFGVVLASFNNNFVFVQWEIEIKGKRWVVRQCLSELAGQLIDPESLAVIFAEKWKRMAREDFADR